MSYNCFAEKVAKGPKRHVVSKVLQKAINIEGAVLVPPSVATAWLESRKPEKPSSIEAEPSCRDGFGFTTALA